MRWRTEWLWAGLALLPLLLGLWWIPERSIWMERPISPGPLRLDVLRTNIVIVIHGCYKAILLWPRPDFLKGPQAANWMRWHVRPYGQWGWITIMGQATVSEVF